MVQSFVTTQESWKSIPLKHLDRTLKFFLYVFKSANLFAGKEEHEWKMKCLTCKEFTEVYENVNEKLNQVGFEVQAFKIGWYNKQVQSPFILPYDDNTLAFLVISTPDMFEKGFKQFLCRQDCTGVRDPIDQCVAYYFSQVIQAYPDYEIDAIHDFELNHNRRPKVLIQTVAHISGAAYYYQRTDVEDDPWPESQKICGVCVHPRYGGWFAMRGVLIFKDVTYSDLQQSSPIDCVPDQSQRISLLEKFNFHWQDWTFRDVIEAEQKYTEEQKDYFATRPGDRQKVIESIKNGCQNSENS